MKNLVKKVVFAMLLVMSYSTVNAQVKGQLDVLRELGEGAEFKEYYSIYEGDDGKWKGTAYKAISILKFEYNMHDKLSAFSMIDKETGEKSIYKSYGYMLPNHYTEPSMFHIEGPNKAFLFIDGLFYSLEGVKDPNAVTKIKIEFILIPEKKEAAEDNGEKKKLSMKEKIAAAKAALKEDGNTTPKEISEKDHIAIIKKYLADMKPIQEKATASFSAETKQEILDIENADADFLKLRQEQSREYAAKLNAQKNGGSSNYTIKNTTGGSIKIITGSGSTTTLNAGSSTTYICSTDVYFCVGENSKGSIIADGDDACGTTIEL